MYDIWDKPVASTCEDTGLTLAQAELCLKVLWQEDYEPRHND